MEFLKGVFGDGALTFDQFVEKAKEAKLNIVNLAEGGYVAQAKFDDKTKTLAEQVKELKAQLEGRDTDLATVRGQLTAAQADVGKLAEAQKTLDDMRTKYDTDSKAYEDRLTKQAYEFAIREKAGSLKFTSTAAKKAFIQEAIGKAFKQDGETLEGYDDFVTKYRADDPGAFVQEQAPTQPTITMPSGGTQLGQKRSLLDLMKAKNDNPNIEVKFDN